MLKTVESILKNNPDKSYTLKDLWWELRDKNDDLEYGMTMIKHNQPLISSEFFNPTLRQSFVAEKIWDDLRPLQKRNLLENSLNDEQKDDKHIHDAIDYVSFRKFSELDPSIQKSITFMIGGKKADEQ